MQEKIRSPESFLDRTDALAKEMGIPLRDMAIRIGISPASLFNYRSRKAVITEKVWKKLEAAEALAWPVGVGEVSCPRTNETGPLYAPRGSEEERDRRLARIEALLLSLAKHLGIKIDEI